MYLPRRKTFLYNNNLYLPPKLTSKIKFLSLVRKLYFIGFQSFMIIQLSRALLFSFLHYIRLLQCFKSDSHTFRVFQTWRKEIIGHYLRLNRRLSHQPLFFQPFRYYPGVFPGIPRQKSSRCFDQQACIFQWRHKQYQTISFWYNSYSQLLCPRISSRLHHYITKVYPLNAKMNTCGCYVLWHCSYTHGFVPGVHVLFLLLQSYANAIGYFLSDSLPALEIGVVYHAQGFFVPFFHGESDQSVRRDNLMSSWRQIKSVASGMDSFVIPPVFGNISQSILYELILDARKVEFLKMTKHDDNYQFRLIMNLIQKKSYNNKSILHYLHFNIFFYHFQSQIIASNHEHVYIQNNEQQNQNLMSKKYNKIPSIAADIPADSFQEYDKQQKSERSIYLSNLKAQCQIRQNALKTAESLIKAYKQENQFFKEENLLLRQRLLGLEGKVHKYQKQENQLKNYQKSLLKYSKRMNELLEANIILQQKNNKLSKQLERYEVIQNKNELKQIKLKLKQKKGQNMKELNYYFNNYSESAFKDDFNYRTAEKRMDSSKQKESGHMQLKSNDKKVLQWKLKQKDEQVLILLKRLKDMQDHIQQSGKEIRHFDSVQVFSTKQSKKLNISDLQEQ